MWKRESLVANDWTFKYGYEADGGRRRIMELNVVRQRQLSYWIQSHAGSRVLSKYKNQMKIEKFAES